MEESETAPIRGKAAAQIVPSGDFVYSLVLDQFLQNDCGGIPIDALECQKAAVEPGTQQMRQIRVDSLPLRMLLQCIEYLPAHCNQGSGRTRGSIQSPEQFLPRRFNASLQGYEILLSALSVVRVVSTLELNGIRRKLGCKRFEECGSGVARQSVVRRKS